MITMRTGLTGLALALLLSTSAYAQQAGTSADANSQSGSAASNDGNNQQRITFEGSQGSKIPRQAPSVVAPALTTTLSETCMGSTSGGLSAAGFGLSFGSTWRDEACIRRLDARELRSFGAGLPLEHALTFHIAAKERMCEDPKIRAAFERTGAYLGDARALCQATADTRRSLAKAPTGYVERQDMDGEAHRGKPHQYREPSNKAASREIDGQQDWCRPNCNDSGDAN